MSDKNTFIRNQDLEEKIVKLYCEGNSATEVLEKLNNPFKTNKSVYDILTKYNIERRAPYENNITIPKISFYFSNIDTKEKAYHLGLMITDGWIAKDRNIIGFSSIDKELTYSISNAISFGENVTIVPAKEYKILDYTMFKKEAYQYQASDLQLKNDLIKLGFSSEKTFNEFLPYLKPELMPHLIRGILDGDGCIYKLSNVNQVGLIFYSGSVQFLNQLKIFLWTNLRIDPPEIKKTSTISKISYCQTQFVTTICNYLYQDSENLRLERKYKLWKSYEN